VQPRSVVISGFATLDYVARLAHEFVGRGTAPMQLTAWSRPGGAVLYAGEALARAGHAVQALSAVGDDTDASLWRACCVAARIGIAGVATQPGSTTMRCLLLYQPDGAYGCLLQPFAFSFDQAQLALLADAALVVIAAGDPVATLQVLACMPPSARVAWIAKQDATCFPDPLAARLAARADIVFCNEWERPWIDRFGPGAPARLLFETRGAHGVRVVDRSGVYFFPAKPIDVLDATGAGDTFAGAALARLLDGAPAREAARAGLAAAGSLLGARAAHAR
jgi:ribokinase